MDHVFNPELENFETLDFMAPIVNGYLACLVAQLAIPAQSTDSNIVKVSQSTNPSSSTRYF